MGHREGQARLLQFQTRFRLNATPGLSQEEKLALRIQDGNLWRRSHTKSRLGCTSCKSARVKCSETLPQCERCAKRCISCVYTVGYPTPSQTVLRDLDRSQASSTTSTPSASQSISPCDRPATVKTALPVYKFPVPGAVDPEPLLRFFVTQTCANLIADHMQQAYHKHVLPFAMSHAPLWHAILAMSSRHIMFSQPMASHYRTAYFYHAQCSATTLAQALQRPPDAETGVLGHCTVFLMNVISFSDSWSGQNSSWVLADEESELNRRFSWIRLQATHQTTLRKYDTFLPNYNLYQAIFADNGPLRDFQDPIPARDVDVSPSFARLCGIVPTSTAATNQYFRAVHILQRIIELDKSEPQDPHFGVYMGFMAEMEEEFLELLRGKDQRALLIFAYWLCQLNYMNLWWTVERARNECRAICRFLKMTGTDDVRRLLDYPMAVCELEVDAAPDSLIDMTRHLSNK